MAKTLILNFKNYKEILGEGSLKLSLVADGVFKETGVEMIVAPPAPFLSQITAKVKIPVFAQSLGDGKEGQSTGSLIPEAISASGAAGALLNHSESRLELPVLERISRNARDSGLKICICSGTPAEMKSLISLNPDYFAIEPPELIGTGRSVSVVSPGLISEALAMARSSGFRNKFLCGAGVSSSDDVKAAVKLGMDGVLLSSSVVKAKDWHLKLFELAAALGS